MKFKKCPQPDKQEKIFKALDFETIEEYLAFGRRVTPADLSIEIPIPTMKATATTTPNSTTINFESEVEKRHQNIISEFKDKERATRINDMLVKIESLDPELFIKLEGYLEGKLEDAEEKASTKKNGTLNK